MTTTDPTQLPDPADLPLFGSGATPQAHRLGGTANPPAQPAEPNPWTTPEAPIAAKPSQPLDGVIHLAESTRPEREATVHDLRDVDWALVRQVRNAVADRISNEREGQTRSRRLDRDLDGDLAWRTITEELRATQSRRINAGVEPMDPDTLEAHTHAVMDAIFGLGRMERFMHEPDLEDISIRGCDNVWLKYGDGRVERGPNAADSDEELTEDIQHYAATAPEGERAFSAACPELDLSIDKTGHRLSAIGFGASARPYITIRRQGFTDTDLSDAVRMGTIDEVLAQFLSAAIRAGVNTCVSGLAGAGKTTLIRAMLNELDPDVALATIETEYELALHQMPHRHHNVWATQYRPGGEDGAGEVSLVQLVKKSLRQSVDRIIVGEVRGEEAAALFDAMQAGKGGVCTVHATSARDTVERLVNCAIRVPPTTVDFAYRQVAAHIHLVVHIAVKDETPLGGRKHRFVDEVIALHRAPDKDDTQVGATQLFKPGPDGRAVPTGDLPSWIDQLEVEGFDPSWLTNEISRWPNPLPTLEQQERRIS